MLNIIARDEHGNIIAKWQRDIDGELFQAVGLDAIYLSLQALNQRIAEAGAEASGAAARANRRKSYAARNAHRKAEHELFDIHMELAELLADLIDCTSEQFREACFDDVPF